MQKNTHVHGETYKQRLNYSQKRLSDFDSPYGRARAPFTHRSPAGRSLRVCENIPTNLA